MSLTVPKAQLQTTKKFDSQQTLKAAAALVRHLEKNRDETKLEKPSLLDDDDEENKNSKLDVPLWLLVTAKEHLATSHSLQPGKVTVPHPIYSSPQTRICLITADPPESESKTYKNLVKHKSFPKDIGHKIKRVVAYTKLARKYKAYEARRQLLSEYDVFLVDQRIARLLPAALGKIFYQSTTKRPIPVSLTGKENWGKKTKKTAYDRLKPKSKVPPNTIGKPEDVGADIEKALSTLAINLSPSPTLSVKIAYAAWPAEWIAENVDAVVDRVVLKYVPNKWNGLKSLFLKGPDTAALPIWMADELWRDQNDVLDEGEQETGVNMKKRTKDERQRKKEADKGKAQKRLAAAEPTVAEGKKRKRALVEQDVVVTKRNKKVTEPVEVEKSVEPTKNKGKQKRKNDEYVEEDEEFVKAQELHKKIRAKKELVISREPTTDVPQEITKEVAKLPVEEKAKPVAKESLKPAAKETSKKEKTFKDATKKQKKGNMVKGQPKEKTRK